MTDKRAYFKLDVGYLTNPKVAAVSMESPAAVILHIGCIAYAAQHFTDGVVPLALVLRLTGATPDDAALLYKFGLLIDRGSGEAEVHDYLEHQRSAAEVKGATVKAKRAAAARWTPERDASSNASSIPDALPGAVHDASEVAMPREREEREREEPLSSEAANAAVRPEVLDLLDLLDARILANGAAKPPARNKKNLDAARLLLDRDGYTVDQVRAAIEWSQRDEFWRTNILSMSKLRERYEQLRLAAQRVPRPGAAGTAAPINHNQWMTR